MEIQPPTAMPAALEKTFAQISEDAINVHARWQLYKQVYGKSSQRVGLLNRVASYFFAQVQALMIDDAVLGVCRLLDRESTAGRANLSLDSLVPLLDPSAHQDLLVELDVIRAELERKSRPFKKRRHKLLAHRDTKVALAPQAFPLPGITSGMFDALLAGIRRYLNAIEGHFDDRETAYDNVITTADGEDLVLALQRGIEFEKLEKARAVPRHWRKDSEFPDA